MELKSLLKNKLSFSQKVWNLCKRIPKGRVSTYREIAKALKTKAYRAVGSALNKNPYAPVVPCHRVVNSDGRVGGFVRETKKKLEMLKKEGVKVKNNKIENFEKVFFRL